MGEMGGRMNGEGRFDLIEKVRLEYRRIGSRDVEGQRVERVV